MPDNVSYSYFKTWDEMYFVQSMMKTNNAPQVDLSERASYLFETDDHFRNDYQDYCKILHASKEELSSDPELMLKKKIMEQIDKACAPLSDDPIQAAKQKLTRSRYEQRLSDNHIIEGDGNIKVLTYRTKRFTIGEPSKASTLTKTISPSKKQRFVLPPNTRYRI